MLFRKLFIVTFLGCLQLNLVFAQTPVEHKPYLFATASVGLNIAMFLPDSIFQGLPTSKSPLADFSLQYRVSKNISFGASFAYQTLVSNDTSAGFGIGAYYIFNFYNPGIVASFTKQVSKKIDIYFQTKLNYQIMQTQLQYIDNSRGINSKVTAPIQNPNEFGFQFGLGFNYYFAKSLGLNFETAIGKPYFCKIGINYRVFTKGNPANERKIERVEPQKNKNYYD